MRFSAPTYRYVILALVLVVAGAAAAFLLLGLGLGGGGDRGPAPGPVTGTPPTPSQPTATEPILPPPPTISTSTRAAAPLARATQVPLATPSAVPSPSSSPFPVASRPMTATGTGRVPTAITLAVELAGTATPAAVDDPASTASPRLAPPSPATPLPRTGLYTRRQRLGVCGGGPSLAENLVQQLGFGWYLNWSASLDRIRAAEVTYMPMIRLKAGQPQPGGQALLQAVDANPGAVWLIGNEPDVKWQDDVTPEVYAQAYHDIYTLLKERDPTCQVAIGGVSQPTPLRMRYLDRILETYQRRYGQPMPVDVWNVHNFILREERDSWGVDIPPGLNDQTGVLRDPPARRFQSLLHDIHPCLLLST